MNKRELIKLVSEKLGAANNEIKVAFDIFLQKVAEYTKLDTSIRIPEIGIFHLRKKDPSKNEYCNLLFLPLKYNPQEKNKILSFDVKVNKETELAAGESAFNISIGKPLIPIIGVNRRDFMVQSSYIMLQKNFEDKSDNLLSKSIQLTDLKIDSKLIDTDDEMIDTFLDEYGQYEKMEEQLPDIPWNFGDTSNELSDEQIENLSEEIKDNIDDVEIEIPLDKLPDFTKASVIEDNKEQDIEESGDLLQDLMNVDVTENITEETSEIISEETIILPEESKESEVLNEYNLNELLDEFNFPEERAELNPDADVLNIKDSLEEEHKLDNDVFNLDTEKFIIEENKDNNDVSINTEEFSIDENDLALNVEKTEDNTSSDNEPEITEEPVYSEQEQDSYESSMREPDIPFKPGEDYIRNDSKPDFRVKFGLTFWIILVAFVVLTAGGLYYFLFYNSDADKKQSADKQNTIQRNTVERDYDIPVTIIPKSDSDQTETESAGEKISESKDPVNKIAETPPSQTPPSGELKKEHTQLNIQKKDTKDELVKDYIFSDGKRFTVQISSWKTRSVAENEVRRLSESGFPSYLSEYGSSSGTKWYRVRVGDFSSLEEAEEFIGKNVSKLFK